MTKQFETLPEMTAELAFDLVERLRADPRLVASFGASNISCSRYVEVTIMDEEACDILDEVKIRFSDHADHYGSDITILADLNADYNALLAEAEAAVMARVAEAA